LPDQAGGWAKDGGQGGKGELVARKKAEAKKEETEEGKRERIKQESIIDALSDERVVDEETFQRAVRARERRAMDDEEGLSGPLKDKESVPSAANGSEASNGANGISTATGTGGGKGDDKPKRWAQDEGGKEYPISTERAAAIARWIKESPLSMGGKKKRPKKEANGTNGVNGAMEGLAVKDDDTQKDEEDGPD
jgi:hypothetical protein